MAGDSSSESAFKGELDVQATLEGQAVDPPARGLNGRVRPARGRGVPGLLIFAAVLTTLASLHLYLASRLVNGLELDASSQSLGYFAFLLLFLSLPLAIFVGRLGPPWAAVPARWVGFVWMGSFGVLLTGAVVTDVLRAVASLFGVTPAHASRLQLIVIAVWAVPAILYALWMARAPARLERVQVALPNLGEGLQGVRLAQISDIHIGGMLDGKWLERLVQSVNAQKPDLIVVTGDLVDGSVEELREQVRPLAGLKAPLGVYFVTGNHEYYSGVEGWVKELRGWGITVLLNQHQVITRDGSSFVLGGVTDFNGGHFSEQHASRPDLAFEGAPAGLPRVLLAHQPRSVVAAAAAGTHLQLSGHTHGGQIFPFHFFVRLQQPMVGGLKTLHGVQVYTHRGSGFWGPPMRLGAAPEIAELTLIASSA
jgi:predicted MPP superfamily phosphohydrolase